MGEKTLKEYLEGITKDELVKKMKIAELKYTGLDKIKQYMASDLSNAF